ncbi:AzlC family ABC transporter permease [Pusillimonas minor]|uniref:AzlC family ABC transporter permease n=1 Tax=Pusillimonas minor TaxID=2697024 RepID=A0A842HJG5_9BURK|nr:AzlC family ABC transporter permease [Pusillimonas minor]MBC2768363.1 AzlC family ABC transporter permease [Pusillimonas minor]
MSARHTAPTLAELTTPVAMGYIPLGIVFGFLFVEAGGSPWLAIAASVWVYAGAAQFMMVPMLAAGLPLGAIALATLVVNLRHVFYGISLLKAVPLAGWRRWYCIFALTDETYAVLTALPEHLRGQKMVLLSALNQLWWVGGTALGVWAGSVVRLDLTGLDFVLAALFAVLAIEQWRAKRLVWPVWVAVLGYGVGYAIAPDQALVIAIGLSVLAGALVKPVSPTAGGSNG